jgi:hypothetical protein
VFGESIGEAKNDGRGGKRKAKHWDVCATLENSSKNAGFSANVAQVNVDMCEVGAFVLKAVGVLGRGPSEH